jgi:tetrahydromethanopterin S-methyltransferase subunit D
MGIGVGLVLIAIGAVLTFAVNATFSGFSISTIGVILMVVGAVGVLIDLAIFMPRRRAVTTTAAVDPYAAGSPAARRTVVEDRQVY